MSILSCWSQTLLAARVFYKQRKRGWAREYQKIRLVKPGAAWSGIFIVWDLNYCRFIVGIVAGFLSSRKLYNWHFTDTLATLLGWSYTRADESLKVSVPPQLVNCSIMFLKNSLERKEWGKLRRENKKIFSKIQREMTNMDRTTEGVKKCWHNFICP